MKRKEAVVTFKGEEKFIKPRERTYDLRAGKSEYVGVTEEQPQKPVDNPYGYTMGKFQMPDPTDPAFCDKVKDFINTRGNGTAAPEEIMSAYNAFNRFCKSAPSDETTTETTTSTTTETTTISAPPATPQATSQTIVTPVTPIVSTNLGMRPSSGGGGGGGEKTKEKKSNLLYIILGVGVVGAAVYYFTRKRKG